MRRIRIGSSLAVLSFLLAIGSTHAANPPFTLAPGSPTLPPIPATAADILVPAVPTKGLADPPRGPPPFPGIGLAAPPPDNLIGLDLCPVSSVFTGAALTAPVYYTLAPGSPSLAAIPATTADVIVKPPGAAPPI